MLFPFATSSLDEVATHALRSIGDHLDHVHVGRMARSAALFAPMGVHPGSYNVDNVAVVVFHPSGGDVVLLSVKRGGTHTIYPLLEVQPGEYIWDFSACVIQLPAWYLHGTSITVVVQRDRPHLATDRLDFASVTFMRDFLHEDLRLLMQLMPQSTG